MHIRPSLDEELRDAVSSQLGSQHERRKRASRHVNELPLFNRGRAVGGGASGERLLDLLFVASVDGGDQ